MTTNSVPKKPREWNDKALLVHQRESWANDVNAALEKAGRSERVDHRSLKDRNIDRIPEPKIGKEAMGMKKRGVVEDPERCKLVRWMSVFERGDAVGAFHRKDRGSPPARHGPDVVGAVAGDGIRGKRDGARYRQGHLGKVYRPAPQRA